ncbi:MAG: AI-2E family transporter [Herpetosiphon sp.]
MIQTPPVRFPYWAKVATIAGIALLFVLLLRSMGSLLRPFAWGIVIAYLLNPIVRVLTLRTTIRRFWGVLFIYAIFGLVIYTVANTLVPLLGNQIAELQSSLPELVTRVKAYVSANGTLSIAGFSFNVRPVENDFVKLLSDIATGLPATVPRIVLGFVEGLVLWIIFLVVTFYLLLQGEDIVDNFYNLLPLPYRPEIRTLVQSIDRVLGAYIRAQIILIIVMSLLTWAALSIIGVQYALILGIATGFLEVIPFVGPYSAAGIAILVSFLQTATPFGWPNWVLALVVTGIYTVLRQTEDHLIIPNLIGHIVQLNPVIVIFAVLAGGHLGGPLGLFIGIPVAATLRIILRYLYAKLVDHPQPLLEGRGIDQHHGDPDTLAEHPVNSVLTSTTVVRNDLHDSAPTR